MLCCLLECQIGHGFVRCPEIILIMYDDRFSELLVTPAFEFARIIATARIIFPHARVRLSAGRDRMSREAQALCFLAGANSIFSGDVLLTTANPQVESDAALLEELGLRPLGEPSDATPATSRPAGAGET